MATTGMAERLKDCNFNLKKYLIEDISRSFGLGNLDYTYFPKKATCSVKRSYPRRKTERIRFVSLDCYL